MTVVFKELAGSPVESFSPQGMQAERKILCAWADRDANPDRYDAGRRPDQHADRYADANQHANQHTNRYANGHHHAYLYAYGDQYPDQHADLYAYADQHADPGHPYAVCQ